MNQSLTSGEISHFFHTLRKGDSPGPQEQASGGGTEMEDSSDVYEFKSQPSELPQAYATLPRKPRSKASSPAAKNQVAIAIYNSLYIQS